MGVGKEEMLKPVPVQTFITKSSENPLTAEPIPKRPKSSKSPQPAQMPKPAISLEYIGKIILAFILIFVLGGIFTLALENLPTLILFINNSLM